MIRSRLVEQMVLNPPKGMEGWRMFRIEYGEGMPEGLIWLPGYADRDGFERELNDIVRWRPGETRPGRRVNDT